LVLKAKGIVIRPGCVYGGAGGLTGMWFEKKPVVGDGSNRWAMVHLDDLGDLYARAAESAVKGELFNATDGSHETVRQMAAAASRAAGGRGTVKTSTLAQAQKLYGGLAHGLALDQLVDSGKAAKLLAWKPRFHGFSSGAERFFGAWKAATAPRG
jgi:nucleoside-diphosphate-sugar epimerase